jgi:DNA-binding XRE family transcriptional regulator
MDVGDRLRQIRERLGMTQGELAAKIGVHETTVTLWENRKTVETSARSISGKSRKS